MKRYVVLLVLMAGCGNRPPEKPEHLVTSQLPVADATCRPGQDCTVTLSKSEWPTHEAEVYAELWRVCKEKDLTYHIRVGIGGRYVGIVCPVAKTLKEAVRVKCIVTNEYSGPTEAAEHLIKLAQSYRPTAPSFDTGQVTPQ